MGHPLSRVLERLQGVKSHAGGYYAKCPAHDDDNASLTVSEGPDGRVLLFCHAKCTVDQIVTNIGLQTKDLFPQSAEVGQALGGLGAAEAVYQYKDESGVVLGELLRYRGKKLRWRTPTGDGRWKWNTAGMPRVPYNVPELTLAVSRGDTVFIVEGEKDADALTKRGLVATTNPGGAGAWRSSYNEYFKGARVVVLGDNDDVGREHQHKVADAISSVAADVRVLHLPGLAEHGDVSDWLETGGTPGSWWSSRLLLPCTRRLPVQVRSSAKRLGNQQIGV